ncbi:carboxymuconolactone decarboxylase family protein [Glycomyces endophyticus]
MRLPIIDPEEMDERQRAIADRIAGRRGAVRGPFRVWLNSPELCDRVESLGAFVRFDSSLPTRLSELALLLAARAFDAQYSWNAHVDKAVDAGIPRAAVEAIARREAPAFDRDEDAAFHAFCAELLADHFVSEATFRAAEAHFGAKGLVEAVGCLGNFAMLAMCLNAFEVDLQPDREPPFPDVRGFARTGTREG